MLNERRMSILGIGILLLLAACDSGQIFHKLRPNSVVLAFGDGLTFGGGTEQGASYPEQLEILIRRKVVNAGVPGEASSEGARRFPGALVEHEPDLVILGYGGSDPQDKLGRQPLGDDLRRMAKAANERGIPVLVIAVPPAGEAAGDADVFQGLAKELKIPLVHVVLGELPRDRQDQDGPVQWTAHHYRALAEAVAEKLAELRAI